MVALRRLVMRMERFYREGKKTGEADVASYVSTATAPPVETLLATSLGRKRSFCDG